MINLWKAFVTSVTNRGATVEKDASDFIAHVEARFAALEAEVFGKSKSSVPVSPPPHTIPVEPTK
jgi:hypothetical protein